jgi:UDP-N-acetylmuramoyl-tripeptide--D-alanyl-D-alanine ligase
MPLFAPEKLAAWTGGRWTRRPERPLTGFNQDTRLLGEGQVFVALKTGQRDGHDFIGEAQAKGAGSVLVAREVPGSALPQLVVTDPLAAFQRIAREHRREFHGTVIGISGSAGKTSTKDLLALLLGGRPDIYSTEGNLNNHIGVPLTLTRLDPAVHTAAVVEAGINMPGEMAALAEMIEPEHSIITLVGPAHLEKLGSLEGVAAEKARLPAANRAGGVAVFPIACWAFAPFRALANPLVLVPANEGMVKVDGRTVRFTVLHRPERSEVTLDGKRNFVLRRVSGGMAQNAALALALASELGVNDAVLQSRLTGWQPSKWRGELQSIGEATVYADFYNANPASMADAIAAFASLVRADLPRLYVLGCMEELGAGSAGYHRQLGRSLLLRSGDFLFVIGDQAEAVQAGLLENGNDPAQIAVITDLAPVRDRLTGFKGAVFLKASRRYKLETVLAPAAVTTAHA